MKKTIITMALLLISFVSANAMSYEQAREQALFLSDKMAYELNLTESQYEAAYEINLDYLMSVDYPDDVFAAAWSQRNADLRYILYDWQYEAYILANYFYRPLTWSLGAWHFGIYAFYPHRDFFYYHRPSIFYSYRGGHSWRYNGGRSWYRGRADVYRAPGIQHNGMRDNRRVVNQRRDMDQNRRSGNMSNTRSVSRRSGNARNEGYGVGRNSKTGSDGSANYQRQNSQRMGSTQTRQGGTYSNGSRTYGSGNRGTGMNNRSIGTTQQQRSAATQRQSSGTSQRNFSNGGTFRRESSTRSTVGNSKSSSAKSSKGSSTSSKSNGQSNGGRR